MNSFTDGRHIWQHGDQRVHLLKEKAIWVEEEKAILVADTHFGKAGHFRKSGIPIPETVHVNDYLKIHQLILKLGARKVYFLGDLFHSDHNDTWTELLDFLDNNQEVSFYLVLGNHDVMPAKIYASSRLEIIPESYMMGSLILSHEPLKKVAEGKLNVCGHLHPGLLIKGKSKQFLKLPCYYFSKQHLIMPAFGSFTGLMKMSAAAAKAVMVTTPESVIPIKLKNKVC
ncbi:ligase-associated DNA damage response endonuclease PdeM [Cyclobacterium plantarum]|uniref:ligase-associated DNA damage response endonuclease PdeM n=1 Tax=Cyclobacterium plantarum TaxID=2716263 RepID=UPI003F7277C2